MNKAWKKHRARARARRRARRDVSVMKSNRGNTREQLARNGMFHAFMSMLAGSVKPGYIAMAGAAVCTPPHSGRFNLGISTSGMLKRNQRVSRRVSRRKITKGHKGNR